MDHKIVWQKWMDPFGSDDDDPLSQDYDHEPEFLNDQSDDQTSKYDDKIDEKPKDYKKHAIRVMATPMGIIPITENTVSSKIFNFWIGHTNFNITKKIAQIIEDTPGVETLDIFTRYRFRIAIGKVFTDSIVMREINENVYEYLG
jgi:hypothetical protein